MELRVSFDLDKIFLSRIGRFGLAYDDFLNSERSRGKPKDLGERFIFLIIHILGKAAILYLKFFTHLYLRSLSEDEIKALRPRNPFV